MTEENQKNESTGMTATPYFEAALVIIGVIGVALAVGYVLTYILPNYNFDKQESPVPLYAKLEDGSVVSYWSIYDVEIKEECTIVYRNLIVEPNNYTLRCSYALYLEEGRSYWKFKCLNYTQSISRVTLHTAIIDEIETWRGETYYRVLYADGSTQLNLKDTDILGTYIETLDVEGN